VCVVLNAVLRSWSAWAPGHTTHEDWKRWAAAPTAITSDETPDGGFLPAMLRRRCTPLTRLVLTAAYDCCPPDELTAVRTVFASRHGSINESIGMLEAIVRHEPLSPNKFSHTVHNAQAGLFSIAAGNREASSSLAGQEDTFGCGCLEALTHLEREPERPVLLVMGDVPLAATFAELVDEPVLSYAVALLVASEGRSDGVPLGFSLAPATERPAPRPWPDALELVRWLASDERGRLDVATTKHVWTWQRRD
jgi:hypothetical protein